MFYSTHNFEANKTLEFIRQHCGTEYTYVILGRSGPTGKTWLRNQLIERGYNAVELSEDIIGLVEYKDNKNHFIVNRMQKMVLIVLNRSIRKESAINISKGIIFDSMNEANTALSSMRYIIKTYGFVTVADFYDLAGRRAIGSFADTRYGWNDLDNVEVIHGTNGYTLKLPTAIPVD